MPTGRVLRIDDDRRVVYLTRNGRTFAAPFAEVEPHARVPSARVEFRLVRRHGEEAASDVRLRSGTRTNRRQRRFGDLTGARRPGAKTSTIASRNLGVDTATPPARVVVAWLEAIDDLDLDGAVALYRPDGVLHTADGDISGRRHIRAALERLPATYPEMGSGDLRGLGRYVRVAWTGDGEADDGRYIVFVVDRGSIAEQWIDVEPDSTEPTAQDAESIAPPRQVVLSGSVPDSARGYAEDRIDHLIDTLGLPARFVRLKLTRIENPAAERWAMAEVVLDVATGLVRAHASAPSWTEAIDHVVERARVRVGHDRSRRRHRRRGGRLQVPASLDRTAPGPLDAVRDQGSSAPRIVRHRSYAPDELTVDEAAWDLSMLDYDFLLFVEALTGDDALIERTSDAGLVLRLRNGEAERALSDSVNDVAAATSPTPELEVEEAVDLLVGSGEQVVFFVDRASGRGCAVHRRYDGDLGVITPPA